MPPEEIQALADANGMPVEHFDGHSVVHHPDHGPLTIPHPMTAAASQLPVAPAPPAPAPRRVVLPAQPEMRITAPAPERQARIDADFADMERQLATTRRGGRTPEQERVRELEAVEARAPRVGPHGELPPETQRMLDRQTEETARESEVSALHGSGALARAQDRRAEVGIPRTVVPLPAALPGATSEGVTTLPDGAQIDTRTGAVMGAIPEGTPAAWLTGDARTEAELRAGARSAQAADAQMQTPAPVSSQTVLQQIADGAAPATPMQAPAAPAAPGVMPSAPGGRPIARSGFGAVAPQPAPPGVALPQPASDAMFSQLAQGSVGPRRAPDLIDRQMLHEQQISAAGREDALRQMAAERQIEQQRQADEADRRQALVGARQAYQNTIDRVANARVEPSRWFRNQGVGGTVAATLAVALGAVGQALGGTDTNLALDEIHRAVDQDIQAQQSEIDAGRAAADMQGNMLSITRQEYADRDAAREAARAAMLRQVALQTQAHASDLSDDEARLHADQLHQQLLAQADEADRAAITQELEWRRRAAEIARMEAEAALAQRRAMHAGGPGAPPLVTQAQRQAYDAALSQGLTPEQAAAESFPAGSSSATHPPAHAALSGEERSSIEDLSVALTQVQRELPADDASDIPGYGMTGLFPRLLLSQEGRNLRASVGNLRDAFARDRTGANLPPSELAAFNEILGTSDTASDEDLRHGLALMQAIIAGHLERSASGVDAATRDLAAAGTGARWIE